MNLENGDIILIKVNRFSRWYRWLLAKLIQFFDRNYYHHCAIYFNGLIHEADADGVVISSLERYSGDEILILRAVKPLTRQESVLLMRMAEMCLGSKYDYWGTLFFQLIYRLTGVWLGKTHNRANKKLFCSEHCILPYFQVRGYFPNHWKVSPGDLRRAGGYFYVEYEGILKK
jgi:hypothetical protein